MMLETLPVVEPDNGLMLSLDPHLSLGELCSLFVDCEKTQRRYQWTSGLILKTLIADPATPNKMADFVHWLAAQTGMVLTQTEVIRRLAVHNFYSRFPDQTDIIKLIERGGVHAAYRACRLIRSKPEQVHAILEACAQHPDTIDATLRQFGERRPATRGRRTKVRRPPKSSVVIEVRKTLMEHTMEFDGRKWVPLDVILDLLVQCNM